MKKKVILKRIFHRENWRLAIIFDFDETLRSLVRSVQGSTYSSTNRCFYVDDTEANLTLLINDLKDFAEIDITGLIKQEKSFIDLKGRPGNMTDVGISAATGMEGKGDYEEISQPETISNDIIFLHS